MARAITSLSNSFAQTPVSSLILTKLNKQLLHYSRDFVLS